MASAAGSSDSGKIPPSFLAGTDFKSGVINKEGGKFVVKLHAEDAQDSTKEFHFTLEFHGQQDLKGVQKFLQARVTMEKIKLLAKFPETQKKLFPEGAGAVVKNVKVEHVAKQPVPLPHRPIPPSSSAPTKVILDDEGEVDIVIPARRQQPAPTPAKTTVYLGEDGQPDIVVSKPDRSQQQPPAIPPQARATNAPPLTSPNPMKTHPAVEAFKPRKAPTANLPPPPSFETSEAVDGLMRRLEKGEKPDDHERLFLMGYNVATAYQNRLTQKDPKMEAAQNIFNRAILDPNMQIESKLKHFVEFFDTLYSPNALGVPNAKLPPAGMSHRDHFNLLQGYAMYMMLKTSSALAESQQTHPELLTTEAEALLKFSDNQLAAATIHSYQKVSDAQQAFRALLDESIKPRPNPAKLVQLQRTFQETIQAR